MIVTKDYVDAEDLADSIALHAGPCKRSAADGDAWTGYLDSWTWERGGVIATLYDSDGVVELEIYPTNIRRPTLADADAIGRLLAGCL